MAVKAALVPAGDLVAKVVAAEVPSESKLSEVSASPPPCKRDGCGRGPAAALHPWPAYCASCFQERETLWAVGRREAVPGALVAVGVPPRFQRPDLVAPKIVLEALDDASNGLFLHGDPGVGKSMAMALMVRAWFERWAAAPANRFERRLPDNVWRWIDYPAFTMEVQDAFKNGEGERTAFRLLKALAEAPLLVLDDLGVEKNTPYVVQATYYLLDQREKWLRPTFITTNVPLDELDDQYGMRITDRLAGMCAVRHIEGKSRRLRP